MVAVIGAMPFKMPAGCAVVAGAVLKRWIYRDRSSLAQHLRDDGFTQSYSCLFSGEHSLNGQFFWRKVAALFRLAWATGMGFPSATQSTSSSVIAPVRAGTVRLAMPSRATRGAAAISLALR